MLRLQGREKAPKERPSRAAIVQADLLQGRGVTMSISREMATGDGLLKQLGSSGMKEDMMGIHCDKTDQPDRASMPCRQPNKVLSPLAILRYSTSSRAERTESGQFDEVEKRL